MAETARRVRGKRKLLWLLVPAVFIFTTIWLVLAGPHPDEFAFLNKFKPYHEAVGPGYFDAYRIRAHDSGKVGWQIRDELLARNWTLTTPIGRDGFKLTRGDDVVQIAWNGAGFVSSSFGRPSPGVPPRIFEYGDQDVVVFVTRTPFWIDMQLLRLKVLLHLP